MRSCILKPIFHRDAKTFALGIFASPNAKESTFALPNAKNTDMLVSLALDDANFLRHLTQNPQRESVEYKLRWVFWRWPCIFHVYFMHISCCLCIIFRVGYARISRRKGSFQWNMGLSIPTPEPYLCLYHCLVRTLLVYSRRTFYLQVLLPYWDLSIWRYYYFCELYLKPLLYIILLIDIIPTDAFDFTLIILLSPMGVNFELYQHYISTIYLNGIINVNNLDIK